MFATSSSQPVVVKLVLLYPQHRHVKMGLGIPCKLSPKETIGMEHQKSIFCQKIRKIIQNVFCCNFYTAFLALNVHYSLLGRLLKTLLKSLVLPILSLNTRKKTSKPWQITNFSVNIFNHFWLNRIQKLPQRSWSHWLQRSGRSLPQLRASGRKLRQGSLVLQRERMDLEMIQ